jgi:hypothetical protein
MIVSMIVQRKISKLAMALAVAEQKESSIKESTI